MAMKLLKFLFFTLFFIASVIFFMPKKNLYFYGEKELLRFRTVIGNERVIEHPFSLELEHADIFVEGVRAAKVMDAKLGIYLFSNVLEAHQIRLSGIAKNFLPTKIESLKVRYAVWDPLHVVFEAHGEFGDAFGKFDLKQRKLSLTLKASKTMQTKYRQLLYRMKKLKNGEYGYEQNL